ncbi:regulatory signaling modulator protein AmpE [Teredinibacter haidensis]|uniref:regulatory signaling modulator protein AmpE n=1 Tax=Teredinibacter haidensis TaxID=2731755 RepID=UPI000948DEFC|nr:regulatory signaling modulator protein AmpE [Teredinibacter haidensis]
MNLFIVLIGIAFIQVWGAANPTHKDGWFYSWSSNVVGSTKIPAELKVLVAVGLPLVLLALLQTLLAELSLWLLLPLGIAVLLYSFGRGEFGDIVSEYTKACYVEDWSSALDRAQRLNVQTDDLNEGDWSELHEHVLREAGYRGFERMFAVLFWFFVLGPVGALLYRLTFLYSHEAQPEDDLARRLRWILEWPAVRLLGLSFALTGNFVGCFQRWRECLFCVKRSTVAVLSPLILGALMVDDDMDQTCEVTRKELNLLNGLYTRTLWFWLATASVLIILV